MLKIVNDVRYNLYSKKLSVLVLLELSAAFDTVDLVGLSGTVINWFMSYLKDCNFFVIMDTCSSETREIQCAVPQGLILGPILFNLNLCMPSLGDVIRRNGISFHSNADDTQLYIAVSPDDLKPNEKLFNCIIDLKSWQTISFSSIRTNQNF